MTLLLCLLLAGDGHVIRVVDDATGRGVPLVELETTNKIRLWTDNAGVAVFDEPGLMNRPVWFHVKSDGYEHEKDGFGFRGRRIETVPGGKTLVRLKRLNVAERLYRVTGPGLYAESLKAGLPAPLPDAPGGVLGQDTVQTLLWKDKLWWFWGDTERAAYPLGQFATSGATSLPPGKGGLDPATGVELKYWVDADGFSKKMVQGLQAPAGPIWIDSLLVLPDPKGVERLLAAYVVVKKLGESVQRGFCVWDPEKEQFGPLSTFDVDETLRPGGQPFRDGPWIYFPHPHAVVRVKADWTSLLDLKSYEGFSCLKPGTRFKKDVDVPLDRDAGGRLVWAWKKDTGPLGEKEQEELIKKGVLKADEAWHRLRSENGERVVSAMGTVAWNAHRQRWIAVAHQWYGKPSLLGEVWYAEAEQPWGPFERGVKIATHDKYTFYNVVHHPEFDQEGGRRIYFEGTYTMQFTDLQQGTPRYDYNQIMYRLDLDDPRLAWARR